MQLIRLTSKKQCILSTEYLKQPTLAVERFESKPETPVTLWSGFFDSITILDLYWKRGITETSVTLQPQKLIRELENLYIFDNPKEIRNFLLTNEYLIDILFEAPSHIHTIFGQVPIHLELDRDPEEGWEELFIVIRSPFPAKKAMELENQLKEEWFFPRIAETRGKLNIIEQPQ